MFFNGPIHWWPRYDWELPGALCFSVKNIIVSILSVRFWDFIFSRLGCLFSPDLEYQRAASHPRVLKLWFVCESAHTIQYLKKDRDDFYKSLLFQQGVMAMNNTYMTQIPRRQNCSIFLSKSVDRLYNTAKLAYTQGAGITSSGVKTKRVSKTQLP